MSIVLPNRNSKAQLENGASRIYLGVHYGFDNLQGQLLGLAGADMNIKSNDPAATKLTVRIRPFPSRESGIPCREFPELYGYFGREPGDQSTLDEIDYPRRRHFPRQMAAARAGTSVA